MVIAVRTESEGGSDDRGLVIVKEARTDGDVARLSREALMLDRSRHPGVVELLSVEDRALRLRHGGTALSRLGPYPLDQAAGIVAAVADVVDAIHRLGVVHNDLEADHIVLDARGRPRLCGFGQARELTADAAADDVAALGRLLSWLLRTGAELSWADPPRGLRGGAQRRQARKDLEAIAAQATRADRTQRPSARQMAKAIHAAVPGMHLPTVQADDLRPRPRSFAEIPSDIDPTADLGWTDDDLSFLSSQDDLHGSDVDEPDPLAGLDQPPDVTAADEHGPERARIVVPVTRSDHDDAVSIPLPEPERQHAPGPSRARRVVQFAGLVLVLAVGVVGGAAGAKAVDPFGGGTSTADVTTPTSTEPTSTTLTTTPTTTTASPPTWPDGCTVPDPTGPDVDGDGCPEAVTLDGRTATVGSVTVTLGADGDLVALGDWDCDGIDTPALLRPDTGEVFVFPRWTLDEPLEIDATTVVVGATTIEPGPGACPAPVVRGPDGPIAVEVDG